MTESLGNAWLTRARRCSGKVPNVLSSPCRLGELEVRIDEDIIGAYFEPVDEAQE